MNSLNESINQSINHLWIGLDEFCLKIVVGMHRRAVKNASEAEVIVWTYLAMVLTAYKCLYILAQYYSIMVIGFTDSATTVTERSQLFRRF